MVPRLRLHVRATLARLRARGPILAAAGVVGACMLAGSSSGASSGIVVSATVPSATSITNQCTQQPAWNLGTVLPGSPAVTAVGGNVCRIRFSSSNDTSALRMYQTDRENTAMQRADPQWDMRLGDLDSWMGVSSAPGGRVMAVGTRGNVRVSNDSGATFPIGGLNQGGTWNTLDDVDLVDAAPDYAWAVGHGGIVLRTINGGVSWSQVVVPTTRNLYAVLAIDTTTAYVANDNGLILRTTNSGTNWTPVTSNLTAEPGQFARRAANDMWVASSNNNVRRSTDGGDTWVAPTGTPTPWSHWEAVDVTGVSTVWLAGYVGGRAAVSYSSDHGVSWTDRSTWLGSPLEDLYAVSDTEAWLVGRDGTMLHTTTAGATWTRIDPPTTSSLMGITRATDGSYVFVAANEDIRRTVDGSSFTTSFTGGGSAVPLSGVATPALDRRTIVAVGDGGAIRRSTDRGTSFTNVSPVTSAHLHAVSLAPRGTGWAVGAGGTIIRTTDTGATWTVQASPTSEHLMGVHAVDDNVGWAVGRNGTVLRTTNAGTTWTPITAGTSQHLRAVSALDATTAFVGGSTGRILRTTNGGASWSDRSHPEPAMVFQLHAVSATEVHGTNDWPGAFTSTDGGLTYTDGLYAGGRKASAYVAGRPVWMAGDWGGVWHSDDRGATWNDHGNPGHYLPGRAMAAIDANRVVLVGENETISVSRIRNPIADYGAAGSTWASPASGLFGVCLQDVGAGTTPIWTEDIGNAPGLCQPMAGDTWQAVPQVPTSIASTTLGTDAYVDLVWGFQSAANQPPGTYLATVSFETVAPAA